ncbi:glycosyltransferase [Acinetobacter cumulans]|jgi:glycosyltransferase involved in cell wall biosynthesis|uniref:Glycosyltransferase n=1 Tax=Acinetobacter cumulans TaxID=2136182 RepID=A0A498D4Z1_9GAMM|nr:glycosyltransferase family 4 protein [Acinetobacter cumulans]RLL35848.1 glycosyltransferase [Acinetobacter cumulans]
MHILISAYACSPSKGSEPGVGWGFLFEISKYHKVTVITEKYEFESEIKNWLKENSDYLKNVDFHFIPRKTIKVLEKIYPPSYYWTYQKWQYDVFNYIKSHIDLSKVDIIHQLTMVGFREPGYLWKLNKPFIWGPVGALSYFPLKLLPALNLKGKITYLVYNFLQFFDLNFKKRPKQAALYAHKIIAATAQDQLEIKKVYDRDSTLIEEVGLPLDLYEFSSQNLLRRTEEPLKIVWSGLIIHRKALSIALHALAKLDPNKKWQFHIIGEGPLKDEMITLAKELNIYQNCIFHGWIPRHENLEIMKKSHLMLITSLRDLTSTVTIEAMGCGLPIICFDHCGFSGVVNNSSGIKVPIDSYHVSINNFTSAISKMFNEDYRYNLSEGAVLNSKKYTWKNKVSVLNEIYKNSVLAKD